MTNFRRNGIRSPLTPGAIILLLLLTTDRTSAAVASASAEAFDWRAFLAPFHAVVLHLPIGFLTMAVILEIYAVVWNRGESLRRGIGVVLWACGVSAVVAALLGIFRASGGGYEETTLELHRWTGIAVTGLVLTLAVMHRIAFPGGETRRRNLAALYRVGLFGGVGLLTAAGHYGGNLTHGSKYLFENAPEWVQKWAEGAEAKIAGVITGEIDPAVDQGDTGSGLYAEVIRPAFEKKCFQCHGPEKQKGDYRMDTIEGLFAAGESGIDPIVSGRPLESYLVELVTLPEDDDYVMPPEGKEPLSAEETLALMRWIWNGAETGAEKSVADIP